MDLFEECFKVASGMFTCSELPDDYFQMDEAEQNKWLVENAWEPFENIDGETMFANVTYVANSIKEAVNAGKLVKEISDE